MSVRRGFGLVVVVVVVVLAGGAGSAAAAPVCSLSGAVTSCVFSYTGGSQSWTVPAGVSSVTVQASGAQGGADGARFASGGTGGAATATIAVTAGETLAVFVGGAGGAAAGCTPGAAGFNGGGSGGYCGGGGGGGASDVRQGGSAPADRVVAAAGGGGGGESGGSGGAGGGSVGAAGGIGPVGGGGGTQTGGGAGGVADGCSYGAGGSFGQGGAGGSLCPFGGGGGGGGYYGGGGGGAGDILPAGSGGGGSSYAEASATGVTLTTGGHTGNGEVTISYTTPTVVSVPPRLMVCLAAPHPRADGSSGVFFDVDVAGWVAGVDNPGSIYDKSTPAIYVQGYGTMCQLSDLVTYGGDPSSYTDSGYLVNEAGAPTPAGISPADWGAAYEYYTHTS